jgi:glycosyltransferase involved in cell wall biosynthesis
MDKQLTVIYNNPDPQDGGIPRYAHRILEGFKERDVDFQEIDFTPISSENVFGKVANLVWKRKQHRRKNSHKLSGTNLFVQPELYWPTQGTDIVTVHDLFMKEYRASGIYSRVRQKLYNIRFQRAIDNADHFIAVSTQTRDKLVEEGVDEEDITVINLGIREKFSLEKKYSERENRIGYLGDFRPRKRVGKLLADFDENRYELEHYELVIGGGGGDHEEELKRKYSGKEKIEFEGKIPEEDLVDWYNNLKAFVFPTELEGFGLPVLEATACGTPVFVYEDTKIPEEVQEYCHEIKSVEDIPEKLTEISKEKLSEKSSEVKEKFDWDKTVRETLEALKNEG